MAMILLWTLIHNETFGNRGLTFFNPAAVLIPDVEERL